MKEKTLYILWGALYILCAGLGFGDLHQGTQLLIQLLAGLFRDFREQQHGRKHLQKLFRLTAQKPLEKFATELDRHTFLLIGIAGNGFMGDAAGDDHRVVGIQDVLPSGGEEDPSAGEHAGDLVGFVGVVDGHIHRAVVHCVVNFQIFDFFLFCFLGHRICRWWVGGWQTGVRRGESGCGRSVIAPTGAVMKLGWRAADVSLYGVRGVELVGRRGQDRSPTGQDIGAQ